MICQTKDSISAFSLTTFCLVMASQKTTSPLSQNGKRQNNKCQKMDRAGARLYGTYFLPQFVIGNLGTFWVTLITCFRLIHLLIEYINEVFILLSQFIQSLSYFQLVHLVPNWQYNKSHLLIEWTQTVEVFMNKRYLKNII